MSELNVNTRHYQTAVILSNAVQAGANAILASAGNDIADGFDGERISATDLSITLAASIKSYLMNPTTGGR